jgi:hypothetical protein
LRLDRNKKFFQLFGFISTLLEEMKLRNNVGRGDRGDFATRNYILASDRRPSRRQSSIGLALGSQGQASCRAETRLWGADRWHPGSIAVHTTVMRGWENNHLARDTHFFFLSAFQTSAEDYRFLVIISRSRI